MPAPVLVRPTPVPPMTPPSVRVLPPTAIVRSAPKAMAPELCVRLAVPVKLRSAPRTIGLEIAAAMAASRLPPLMVNVPAAAPKAPVAEFAMSVPPLRVVPPE